MTPEDRARAVVAYFPCIPEKMRGDVEAIITRAIKRALTQQLAELERMADGAATRAEGRGKQAKGRDPSAIHWHRWWEAEFKSRRLRKLVEPKKACSVL